MSVVITGMKDYSALEGIKSDNGECISRAFDVGYQQGIENCHIDETEAYQRGFNDAPSMLRIKGIISELERLLYHDSQAENMPEAHDMSIYNSAMLKAIDIVKQYCER